MSEMSFPLGPPFRGVTDMWNPQEAQVITLDGLLPDAGGYLTAPPMVSVETNRPADRGMYVTGWKGRAVFITVGTSATNEIIYTASRGSTTVVVNLTDWFGECPKRKYPYAFATLAGRTYFAGGQQVFQVDPYSLIPSQMLCETGREEGTIPYLTGRIPARSLAVHNGCMFFVMDETCDFTTDFLVDPSDPYVKNTAAVQTNGMIRLDTSNYLFSDPYEPNHVKFYNSFDIDDEGAEVMNLIEWNSGLLVLTNKGPWYLGGDSELTWTQSKLSGFAGCVAPASMTAIGNRVYWLDTYNVWYADPDTGVQAVPNIAKFLRTYIDWNPDRIASSGAAFLGGRYYVISLFSRDYASAMIAIETATGAACLMDVDVDVLFGCDQTGVFDGGGMLAASGSDIYAYYNDGTGGTRQVTVEWRVNMDRVAERTATRFVASFDLTPVEASVRALGLMDSCRITASGVSTTYPLVGIASSSTTMTPPIGEEGSRWDYFNWVATPAPAGTVTPRFACQTPFVFNGDVEARGRDILIDFRFTVRKATRLEEATLVYDVVV